jgi:hypothetical protein
VARSKFFTGDHIYLLQLQFTRIGDFGRRLYLIHLVVLRTNSINRVEDNEAHARKKTLMRLLQDDTTFARCTYGMLSFAIFIMLQIIDVAFYTLYGGNRTIQAFLFIRTFSQILPNLINCMLLDHLPNVVANRYKYERPLKYSNPQPKIVLNIKASSPSSRS